MLKTEAVLKRTEELLALKKKHIQSDQICALAQALVEAINMDVHGVVV